MFGAEETEEMITLESIVFYVVTAIVILKMLDIPKVVINKV